MAKSKIRISDSALTQAFKKKELPALLKRGNYRFHVLEAPGAALDFYNMPKKKALERALSLAKGCTFRTEEIPQIGFLSSKITHNDRKGVTMLPGGTVPFLEVNPSAPNKLQ